MNKSILFLCLLVLLPFGLALDNPGHYCKNIDTLPLAPGDGCSGLLVNNPGTSTEFLKLDASGMWISAPSTVFAYPVVMGQTLNVGGKLKVTNDAEITGNIFGTNSLTAENISVTDTLCIRGDCKTGWPGGPTGISGSGTSGRIPLFNAATNIVDSQIQQSGANIGIGGAPLATLDVYGNIRTRAILGCSGAGVLETDAQGNIKCGTDDTGGTPGGVGPGTANYISKFNTSQTNVINSQIYDDGTNVGINTNTPKTKLDVAGAINASGDICTSLNGGKCLSTAGGAGGPLNFVAGTGTDNQVPKFKDGGVNITNSQIRDDGTNVGIGTLTPSTKLTVDGGATDTKITVQSTTNNAGMHIKNVQGGWVIQDNAADGRLSINNDVTGEKLTINGVGNVGVGDTTPDAKLTVAGDAIITGNLTAKGREVTFVKYYDRDTDSCALIKSPYGYQFKASYSLAGGSSNTVSFWMTDNCQKAGVAAVTGAPPVGADTISWNSILPAMTVYYQDYGADPNGPYTIRNDMATRVEWDPIAPSRVGPVKVTITVPGGTVKNVDIIATGFNKFW